MTKPVMVVKELQKWLDLIWLHCNDCVEHF